MKRLLISALNVLLWQQAAAWEVGQGEQVQVFLPEGLSPVAYTALRVLDQDMGLVLNASAQRTSTADRAGIVCTIDGSLPREGFHCHVSPQGQLLVEGADAHGIAYGLMEVSHLLGVSAWEDWADVTPRPRERLSIADDYDDQQQPAVAYRGIFINDEDWGLNPWATRLEPEAWVIREGRIKGAVGPQVTERIFRLMLRLRLNYYWPPMHECTQPFFLTPGNREVAARYGIYIGGSHCEPMASSAAAEWGIRGQGEYNYVTNRAAVQQFWQERLDSVSGQEIVYTLGMRGVHDGAMQGVKTDAEKVHYLQQVIDDQRTMLAKTLGRKLEDIPQVFVPYKEVLDIYRHGLQVPDEVTLMWTDDNYGYVRHFPDSIEQRRQGGNGLYYHVSYWGRPHDYCWLSTLSPHLMAQQLTESYSRGIRQIWMLNVGDIKPAEVQIHTFATMAWRGVDPQPDPGSLAEGIMQEMLGDEVFAGMDEAFAADVRACLDESYRLAWDRKPEHMAGTRVEEKDRAYWNMVRPIGYWTRQDAASRIDQYRQLSDKVERLAHEVAPDRQDAFVQLVKYPVQAAAQMNFKYLCPGQGQQAQDSIATLTRIYNKGVMNGGKWDGILSASPRGLRVFQPVSAEELPAYDDAGPRRKALIGPEDGQGTPIRGLGTNGRMLAMTQGQACHYPIGTVLTGDSVTVIVQLLPNHPVSGGKLSFALSADGLPPVSIDYETYDRSEEWKLNVLRNAAERIITLPLDSEMKEHRLTFCPLTEGVILDQIYLILPCS